MTTALQWFTILEIWESMFSRIEASGLESAAEVSLFYVSGIWDSTRRLTEVERQFLMFAVGFCSEYLPHSRGTAQQMSYSHERR
jgi:hypothetical protein